MLIAFSGIDCAGKSTQLELLGDHLLDAGHQVKTLWYRPGYSVTLDRARSLARRVLRSVGPSTAREGVLPNADDPKARTAAFSKPGVSEAWIAMALADTAAVYGARLRLLMARGNTVICDRYLLDAALDFSFRFPAHEKATNAAVAALTTICPRPDIHVLLTLPHDEMLRRMEIKNEPFPDPPRIRDARYAEYLEHATRPGVTAIDASGTPTEVHQRVLSVLAGGQ